MGRRILRLHIAGRVQGVGFRAFVADDAQTRGLAGWVRNRRDGSVEALIAGNSDAIDQMVETCRRGPYGARVEDLVTEEGSESDLAGASGFEILRTV